MKCCFGPPMRIGTDTSNNADSSRDLKAIPCQWFRPQISRFGCAEHSDLWSVKVHEDFTFRMDRVLRYGQTSSLTARPLEFHSRIDFTTVCNRPPAKWKTVAASGCRGRTSGQAVDLCSLRRDWSADLAASPGELPGSLLQIPC